MRLVSTCKRPKPGPFADVPLGEYMPIGTEPALIAVFDCYGCVPHEWHPSGPIFAESETGQFFSVQDFNGCWCDENSSIFVTEHEFRRLPPCAAGKAVKVPR